MKSLIVDDNLATRKMMWMCLSKHGICDAVDEGVKAIQAYEESLEKNDPYELICLDILMPGMDGHETLTALRKLESEKNVRIPCKIMIISAFDEKQSVQTAYNNGADGYVNKPFEMSPFLEQLRCMELIA